MTDDTTEIVVSRILNAPVETVWRLWTDPELVTEWWGPEDYTSPSASIDLREGGSYVFSMQAPADQGGAESFTGGVYTRIVPLERLEFTQSITDEDGEPLPADQLPEGFTERGWTRSLMSVFAYAGMHQSLDKLTTDVLRRITALAG